MNYATLEKNCLYFFCKIFNKQNFDRVPTIISFKSKIELDHYIILEWKTEET